MIDLLSTGLALSLTVRLLGWATFIGALEQLRIGPAGSKSWLQFVAGLQLLVGAVALVTGWLGCAPLVLALHLAMNGGYRGAFNGGSDTMVSQLGLGLTVAAAAPLIPSFSAELTFAGLAHIAVQSVLSYSIAGVIKLKERAWRDGSALRTFLSHPRYTVPRWAGGLLGDPQRSTGMALAASWTVLGFECAFPLALLDSRVALGLCAVAAGFHLVNAVVLGLNRFLWVWLATYPAILGLAQLRAG